MPNILDDILGGAPPPKPGRELVPIADIRRDGATQPRAGLNEGHVADLMQALQDGEPLPAVDVMYDGVSYWLYDGYHRIAAHERMGRTEIAAAVHQGDQPAAQWESYGVNKAHGLKRTNDDKKRAVQAALRHPKAATLSNREIARHVGVDEATVRAYRAEMEATAEIPQSAARKGGDGRVINTAGIGKAAARAATKPPAPPPPAPLDALPVVDAITVRLDADGKSLMDWEPEEWEEAQRRMQAQVKAQAPALPPVPADLAGWTLYHPDARDWYMSDGFHATQYHPTAEAAFEEARRKEAMWQVERKPAPAAKPGELPADLQARGWELRRVANVGKWYCNNRSGSRATGVHEKPEDAIAEAYTMQRDLAWAAQGVNLEPATVTAAAHAAPDGEAQAFRLAADELRAAVKLLALGRQHLDGYHDEMQAAIDLVIGDIRTLIGDLQP